MNFDMSLIIKHICILYVTYCFTLEPSVYKSAVSYLKFRG